MAARVKDYLPWVALMTKIPASERMRWVKEVFAGIRSYRNKQSDASRASWLSDVLSDRKEFELVGFAANVTYVRIDGNAMDLSAMYVHPWGTPTLLLKHKRLPVIIMASPSMRYDASLLAEAGNKTSAVKGFTG